MQLLCSQFGCTILLVTHDNRILDVADRMVRMEDGCLIDSSGNQLRDVVAAYSE